MTMLARAAMAASIWSTAIVAHAHPTQPGLNRIDIRGKSQEVYFYPGTGQRGTVLFLPGDGGWRGYALEMARSLAATGYEVYGWDVRRYLMDFTDGRKTVSQTQMASDIGRMAALVGGGTRVIVIGWSQGAGMAVLAASEPGNHHSIAGAVAIGLSDSAVLGWSRIDDLTWITKKDPNQPTFPIAPLMPRVSPLPLAVIHSTQDEYTSTERVQQLVIAAKEPKQFVVVEARNHRFDGNQPLFLRRLQEAADWVLRKSQ